mmetsp:Transcript_31616/g.51016  ORF Transcript_31616/g.51016 Transcript_31616/m.51016 type:complete len:170 (+) Transcript_31616:60-569(+)
MSASPLRLFCAFTSLVALPATRLQLESPSKVPSANESGDILHTIEKVVKNASIEEVTFGTVSGFCSGVAARKVGGAAASFCGMAFIGAQVAQHYGFIIINWEKLEEAAKIALDQNNDGKLTAADGEILSKRAMAILQEQIPLCRRLCGWFSVGVAYVSVNRELYEQSTS